MCFTVIWAVPSKDFTEPFRDFTENQLGVRPEASGHRIVSTRVRQPATTFTLTVRMCDCDAVIGLGDGEAHPEEISAEAFVSWLRGIPEVAHGIDRISLVRAWNEEGEVTPATSTTVPIDAVDEHLLRDVGENALLNIYYG
ncbi:MAG: hypothetical protein QM713_08555 [Arachnia sp.]